MKVVVVGQKFEEQKPEDEHPENCETGAGEGSTVICCGRTGVRAG